jgi:hypothetical protein
MQRINGHYLYDVGTKIGPLKELRAYGMPGVPASSTGETRMIVCVAEEAGNYALD